MRSPTFAVLVEMAAGSCTEIDVPAATVYLRGPAGVAGLGAGAAAVVVEPLLVEGFGFGFGSLALASAASRSARLCSRSFSASSASLRASSSSFAFISASLSISAWTAGVSLVGGAFCPQPASARNAIAVGSNSASEMDLVFNMAFVSVDVA